MIGYSLKVDALRHPPLVRRNDGKWTIDIEGVGEEMITLELTDAQVGGLLHDISKAVASRADRD